MNFNLNSKVTFAFIKNVELVALKETMKSHGIVCDAQENYVMPLWQFIAILGPHMSSTGGFSFFKYNGVNIENRKFDEGYSWVCKKLYSSPVKLGHDKLPENLLIMNGSLKSRNTYIRYE